MKFTEDHIKVVTNLVNNHLGYLRFYTANAVTIWQSAWDIIHDSKAYSALRHTDYKDAHWETAMSVIFPKLPPRS